jgi:hypothetical protein
MVGGFDEHRLEDTPAGRRITAAQLRNGQRDARVRIDHRQAQSGVFIEDGFQHLGGAAPVALHQQVLAAHHLRHMCSRAASMPNNIIAGVRLGTATGLPVNEYFSFQHTMHARSGTDGHAVAAAPDGEEVSAVVLAVARFDVQHALPLELPHQTPQPGVLAALAPEGVVGGSQV